MNTSYLQNLNKNSQVQHIFFFTQGNMRQHALTHKNSDRSNSPHSSNTNSDNEQTSQTERNRDNDINEQSDDDGDQPEHFNEDNFANKLADRSPSNINNLASIDEEKGQRGGGGLQATNDQDEHEDISRSQSNSSKDSQKHILYMSFHNIAINSYSTLF